jgi:hypothetical protein
MIKTRRKKTDRQKQEALLDELYREIIRKRAMKIADGCQVKIRCKNPIRSYTMLHTAHMFGRGNGTTRWDLRNSVGACYLCHAYLDANRFVKETFFRRILGDVEFDDLSTIAHMSAKDFPVDLTLKEIELRTLLKEV